MDVWRYSDWAGFGQQVRDSQPHIWHWRDWIVESLNADKGYDRMVLEMLAADEPRPDDADAPAGDRLPGPQLQAAQPREVDAGHRRAHRAGVPRRDARLRPLPRPHVRPDHAEGVLPGAGDLRAAQRPHRPRAGRSPTAKDGLPRVYDADLDVPTFLLLRGDDRTPDKAALPPGVPEALGGKFEVEPVELPPDARIDPDRRPFVS